MSLAAARLRDDDVVRQALMVSFFEVMNEELGNGGSQCPLAKQDHPVQTGLSDCAHEPFRVGVQIWRACSRRPRSAGTGTDTEASASRASIITASGRRRPRIADPDGPDFRTLPEAVARLYTVPNPDGPASRTLLNSGEGCVFLDGNVCMIYEARPKTCRDFPDVAIGTHSLGSRPSSLARWAALCPIIFNALESYKHLTGYHPQPPLSTTSKPPA